MKENDKPNGVWVVILMISMLIFVGCCLFNSATDGIFFVKDLKCEEGEYKIIALDYVPHVDEWKIQPDGTYACCAVMNFTENENNGTK